MKTFLILIVALALFIHVGRAQTQDLNSSAQINVNLSYGLAYPGGRLSDRFGVSNCLGFGSEYLTPGSSFIFGVTGFFQFGTKVKEDVLSPFRLPNGQILGINSQYASVFLRMRGLHLSLLFGKLIPLGKNRKTGLRLSISPGVYRHHIRIQDDSQSVPQIANPYNEGYDRLTSGFALQEFIGYQYMAVDRRLNFYAGLEMLQAWTKNRRAANFDTMMKDDARRLDLLFQFKLGLFVPIYFGDRENVRYY